MNKKLIWVGAIIMASTFLTNCASTTDKTKFQNTRIDYQSDVGNIFDIVKAYWNDKRKHALPQDEIPVQPLTAERLTSDTEDAVFRLGHSTILLRIDQEFILFDPVFNERAFPVQWMGPKRFHQTPISIEELPPIKAVIISHDHYDHLDKNAIKQLNDKVQTFVTPLKVGNHLRDWGISDHKITELNWWQHVQFDSIKVTATPAQHFSGRGLLDRDQTLWASWVVEGWDNKVFFSGDTGYFDGFKEIGERFGPFDITLMETGAYNELWSDIHMMPEQSLQAHIDLKGKVMIPIHNGTFDLSLHDWFEPFEEIQQLADKNDVKLATPMFGESVTLSQPVMTAKWWQELMPAQSLQLVTSP